MGFGARLRAGMEQARQAGAMLGTPDAGHTDYAQLAGTLAQSGVPCVALIESIGETGKSDPGGKQFSIEVHVEGNGEPYDATVEQYLVEAAEPSYVPGTHWEAKADPADRSRLLLYGQAS